MFVEPDEEELDELLGAALQTGNSDLQSSEIPVFLQQSIELSGEPMQVGL